MTKEDLKQIRQLISEETESIRKSMATKDDLKALEIRLRTDLVKAIEDSQEDTINTLLDAIYMGYNMHDERIEKIKDHLGIPHPHNN